jgi:hypothetical protein
MGGISYNVWLRGLCAGVSVYHILCGYVACVPECRYIIYCVVTWPVCRSVGISNTVWLRGLCAGVSVYHILCGYVACVPECRYITYCVVTWPVCRSVVVPSVVLPNSASNRNQYQEYFLGVKATGA